jgi:hypothetical protein
VLESILNRGKCSILKSPPGKLAAVINADEERHIKLVFACFRPDMVLTHDKVSQLQGKKSHNFACFFSIAAALRQTPPFSGTHP